MGKIRDRMLAEMEMRGLWAATKKAYLMCCRQFVAHFMKSPEQLGASETKAFILHLIIPTKYFHVVFTLPQQLRALAKANPRLMYELLLESAARTLLDFGKNNLQAQLGVTSILHTWTRDLRLHPHVHCIVTAGGLDDQNRWSPAKRRYLFPVRALSIVFRGKLLQRLSRLYEGGLGRR